MSELDPELLATLRSMLNDPGRDVTEVMRMIREWPEERGRAIAQRYVEDYFSREVRADETPSPAHDGKMVFDRGTRVLMTHDGARIKKMECPLTKKWGDLEALEETDMARRCADCQKKVVNTRGLTDAQVHVLVRVDPGICLHIDERFGNVTFIESDEERAPAWGSRQAREQGLRVIRTARTLAEINAAVEEGFWPVVERVMPGDGSIGSFLQYWQDRTTGEVAQQGDIRYAPPGAYGASSAWEVIITDVSYDPSNHFPSPIAAYLVPEELEVGERVFLEDVIANHVGSIHQGSSRLQSVEATWDGSRFVIEWSDEDAPVWIG